MDRLDDLYDTQNQQDKIYFHLALSRHVSQQPWYSDQMPKNLTSEQKSNEGNNFFNSFRTPMLTIGAKVKATAP